MKCVPGREVLFVRSILLKALASRIRGLRSLPPSLILLCFNFLTSLFYLSDFMAILLSVNKSFSRFSVSVSLSHHHTSLFHPLTQTGMPIRIKSVFTNGSKGLLYIEALAEPYAREAILGLRGIYGSMLSRVPGII